MGCRGRGRFLLEEVGSAAGLLDTGLLGLGQLTDMAVCGVLKLNFMLVFLFFPLFSSLLSLL